MIRVDTREGENSKKITNAIQERIRKQHGQVVPMQTVVGGGTTV